MNAKRIPEKADRENLPVFVYGTLRNGQKNYRRFLEGKTRRELAALAPGLLFFDPEGGHPYVVPGEGKVVGDLMFLLPESYRETLRNLDALEDYDPRREAESLYLRRPCPVFLNSGDEITAWIYLWNHPRVCERRIPSGDFLDLFRTEKP